MKFRYKVLIINIIILSASLGLVGYLMIKKNFKLALETQIQNAVLENNLTQSSVEYELLQIINLQNTDLEEEVKEIGDKVNSGFLLSDSSFYIKFNDEYVYEGNSSSKFVPESLFENLEMMQKNYIIVSEGEHFIYVTSNTTVNDNTICVITKRNIEEAYSLMKEQLRYYQMVLLIVLLVCSVIVFIISTLLTRPMEQLNRVSDEFARGNYDERANVKTNDEIGLLAAKYNHMAESVSFHIDELNAMIKRRDQFVADFTHEIKTPMTTIIGYSDMMRSMELSREDQLLSLNYIFSEGKRLEAMSMKLFDLIYLRQNEIAMTKLHVGDLISEVSKTMTPMLKKRDIIFVENFEDSIIAGDRELLKTVFINLIDNAKKASEAGSKIELTGKKTDSSSYSITVTDHGIGMSEEVKNNICNEFYMADKSRSRKEGGAGLGMSLVAIILNRHDAKLDIESVEGEGTSVTVTFRINGGDDDEE